MRNRLYSAAILMLGVVFLTSTPTTGAMELKAVDLEVQSLGDDDWMDDRINIRPTVTFSLSERLDFQTGVTARRKMTQEQWLFGFYTKFSYKPGKKADKMAKKPDKPAPVATQEPSGVPLLLEDVMANSRTRTSPLRQHAQ